MFMVLQDWDTVLINAALWRKMLMKFAPLSTLN